MAGNIPCNIMVDIETLSTKYNAAILCIAAIKFDKDVGISEFNNLTEKDYFFACIDPKSYKNTNFDIETNTLKWWKKQDQKIQDKVFSGKNSLKKILKLFNQWVKENDEKNEPKFWAHGCSFDFPILNNAFNTFDIAPPWKYWNLRDTRTLYDVFDINLSQFSVNKHHPLYDCYAQIKALEKAFEKMNRKV